MSKKFQLFLQKKSVKTIKRLLKIVVTEASMNKLKLGLPKILLDQRNVANVITADFLVKPLMGRELHKSFIGLLHPPITNEPNENQRKIVKR